MGRVRTALVMVAALATMSTAACAGGSAARSSATAEPGVRLANAVAVADPKAHQGPSTATIGDRGLRPITPAPRPELPTTVTDAQGTAVTIPDVSRVLALDVYGTLSRTVYELGLGERVVGRDTSSGFAEISHLPLVTPVGHDLSAEAILALDPSVIITDTSLGPWDVLLQMRESGIPVVIVDSTRGVATTGPLIRQVADALGVPAAGDTLAQRTEAEITAKIAQIAAIAPVDPADRLRVVFLYVRGQAGVYYLFGQGSGVDTLVTAVGARDVATEIGWRGMRPLNDEGLVKAAPDLVLMMSEGLHSVGGVDGLMTRFPALANTPAGQNRRIVDMADADLMAFGPGTPEVLDALAVALYAPADPR